MGVVFGIDDLMSVHNWAAARRQNQSQKRLPRSGAIFPFAFCQSQWLALALPHVVGQDLVGRIDLGIAFPDGLAPIRTFSGSTQKKASEPDREGL